MRERFIFVGISLLVAFFMTRGLVARPSYTDAYYHFNAANRLVSGQGLTDAYLWNYIGMPDSLPTPSHLYWMPLTSLVAALGMWLLNAQGNYAAAQWPFALMLAGTAYVGYWLGGRLGGSRRHAWVAGLLTLFSGYFTRFWGATDTFAPYALAGSLCLLFLGLGVSPTDESSQNRRMLWFTLAGMTAGLAHLTRADGVLLLIVAWLVILWPGDALTLRTRGLFLITLTAGYLVVMAPWFIRNLNAIGSALPIGGAQSIWFTEYDDLFKYPPDSNMETFFANGASILLSSRWEAFAGSQGLFSGNLGTFVAVEGLIVMTPLMLIGLWQRRRDGFLRGLWLYALGLHLAMTLIFPYPGYRGGLFHSAAALVPWWAALGVVGLDDCIDWIARRRRHWNAGIAKVIFSAALVLVAIFLSVAIVPRGQMTTETPELYQRLLEALPPDARVMINDPAQLYYFTGLGGVTLPNEVPDVILDIARRYDVDYLVLEGMTENGGAAAPSKLLSILETPPDFLTPVSFNIDGIQLYEIRH
jgi:4-amino-4-deoxy-L-arabinose transferase-like glycosyltransferase